MFISNAFAQSAGALPAQGSMAGTLIQLGLIFLIFYILLIRPQQKKIRQHEAMLSAIKKGDEVVIGGGIYGKVTDASDPFDLVVEIADGVKIKVVRATVRELLTEDVKLPLAEKNKKADKSKAANSNKKEKK